MLFSELAAAFLSEQKPRLRENSFANMRYNLESYLLPVFGEIDVAELSEAKIIDGMKKVSGKSKISAGTLKTNFILLKQIARFGMKKGLVPPFLLDFKIDFDDFCGAKPNESENSADEQSGNAKTELSEDDVRKIILAAKENPDSKKLGVLLSLCLGLKIGEICALRWSDIDIIARKVKISRIVQRIGEGNGSSRIVVQSRGSSERILNISENLALLLNEKFQGHFEEKSLSRDFFILTNSQVPTEARVFRRFFAKFLEEIGVEQVKFNALKKFYDLKLSKNLSKAEKSTSAEFF